MNKVLKSKYQGIQLSYISEMFVEAFVKENLVDEMKKSVVRTGRSDRCNRHTDVPFASLAFSNGISLSFLQRILLT
jgi:hypothetical protein